MENLNAPDPTYQDAYRLLPDLAKLRDAISPLPTGHRLAFAICCCERLYSGYHAAMAILKTPDTIRPILDRLWKHVLGREMTEIEIAERLSTCMSLQLGENDCCKSIEDAVDAVEATIVSLRACREYMVDNVVRAAEVARDKVDRPLWKELAEQYPEGIGPEEHREIEKAIRLHPTMVAEIEREAAQLRFLYECEELTESTVAQLLGL